jgi:hypothetical protein
MALSHVRILLNVGKARKSGPPSHRPLIGKIKRTGVRWLPLVARVCLHIGFCTLRRRLDGTPRGGAPPLSEISSLISILQARARATCVDESARRLFATLRVDAI